MSTSDYDGTIPASVHVEKNVRQERSETQQRLIEDGYALIDSRCDEETREKVATIISDLETKHSLPATFALLFDETWHLAIESQRSLLQHHAGLHQEMSFNFDMLAWNIDPTQNQVGFSPHRDRQPDTDQALKHSFYSDGQAKYVTHWIALTDANPNNSCLCKCNLYCVWNL
jgi:ectoine hydroxylase-related dioxygenase (phytanoyl-CoA dioxygenase family)